MFTNSRLDELIVRAYDVVTAPQQWQPVLNEITGFLEARASNIFYGDSQHPELHGVIVSDVLDGLLDDEENVEIIEAERPLYSAIPEIIGSLEMTTEADLLGEYNRLGYPPMQLDGIYRWLREKYGIYHRMTSPLNKRPNYFDFLTVHYGDSCTTPPQEAMQRCNQLLPHLAKAIEINRPFALLEARYRAVLDVLDRLQLGVIMLGKDRNVWLMNNAASIIIEKRDSLWVDHSHKLTGRGTSIQNILDACFSKLSVYVDLDSPQSIRIQLPREERGGVSAESYIADISLLNNQDLNSRAGFVMVLVDPDRSEIVDLSNFATLFGLTRVEAAVCDLLIKGYTNREIAESRNVSYETVATQVKALFAKTSSRRRSDIVHLAHSVNIPMDAK